MSSTSLPAGHDYKDFRRVLLLLTQAIKIFGSCNIEWVSNCLCSSSSLAGSLAGLVAAFTNPVNIGPQASRIPFVFLGALLRTCAAWIFTILTYGALDIDRSRSRSLRYAMLAI